MFVGVDVVHEGLDLVAVGEAGFGLALGESFGELVAEAAGFHEGGPPGELLGGAWGAEFAGPGEGGGVICAVADDGGEVLVIDAKELAGPEVHA